MITKWRWDIMTEWHTLDFGVGFGRAEEAFPGWNIRFLLGPWLISVGRWPA